MEWYKYVLISVLGGNFFYIVFGGIIHWWHYDKNRKKADSWKIQPNKFIGSKQRRNALILGLFNMNMASLVSGTMAWGIFEREWTQVYFNFNEYGYGWAILSFILVFMSFDALAYYYHVLSHTPFMYKHFHIVHHRFTAPEFFTLSAVHPVEWLIQIAYTFLPIFIFPIHWSLFIAILVISFLYGFFDHSGIKLGFNLPFHGSNKFHDDHHKYFHVNFGFLTPLWDLIHDTARREGHQYREDTFTGGKGLVNYENLGEKAIGPPVNYRLPSRKV